jgi:hypothetical protein
MNYGISGAGEFGEVYKGVLTTKDNQKVPIAAKTLKVVHRTIIMHVHKYCYIVLWSSIVFHNQIIATNLA